MTAAFQVQFQMQQEDVAAVSYVKPPCRYRNVCIDTAKYTANGQVSPAER